MPCPKKTNNEGSTVWTFRHRQMAGSVVLLGDAQTPYTFAFIIRRRTINSPVIHITGRMFWNPSVKLNLRTLVRLKHQPLVWTIVRLLACDGNLAKKKGKVFVIQGQTNILLDRLGQRLSPVWPRLSSFFFLFLFTFHCFHSFPIDLQKLFAQASWMKEAVIARNRILNNKLVIRWSNGQILSIRRESFLDSCKPLLNKWVRLRKYLHLDDKSARRTDGQTYLNRCKAGWPDYF